MAHAEVAVHLGLGRRAGHEPHAELAQHPLDVEHGRPVDLGEGVPQRGEAGGSADLQRRRRGQAGLDRRPRLAVGPVDEERTDARRRRGRAPRTRAGPARRSRRRADRRPSRCRSSSTPGARGASGDRPNGPRRGGRRPAPRRSDGVARRWRRAPPRARRGRARSPTVGRTPSTRRRRRGGGRASSTARRRRGASRQDPSTGAGRG